MMVLVVDLSQVFLIFHHLLECDGVDPNSAEYVCSECVGAGGGHHAVQSWFGECDG